jgi:NAD(P)-dependent dehydrogenase (short-subunit alcohol dehydrogenase family)
MKNIIITGSSKGLGFEMAIQFLESGCNVTLSGRGKELSSKAMSALLKFDGHYLYVPCNVQIKADVQNLWDMPKNKWGKIDIWINNAGQNVPHEYAYNTDESYINNVIATNLNGMIYGSQIAAKGMIEQKSGAIYSMEGLGSNNMIQPKTILYGTTKHALTYFMRGLAKELEGTGVTAGRLSPGMMLTDFLTKTPDGQTPALESEEKFRRLFNILGDKPETVAEFFVARMLTQDQNDAHIIWLTNAKAMGRFISAPITKRKLI